MDMFELLNRIIYVSIPLIFAITVHEIAHGYCAKWLGDPTAERAGRLTLNPIAHIDPIGTIVVPLSLLALSWLSGGGFHFIFGWAKPVPVQPRLLRRQEKDMVWVAAAGPFSNLCMALLWASLFHYGIQSVSGALEETMVNGDAQEVSVFLTTLLQMAHYGILINIMLFLVNLFPLLPFDGGRIVYGLVPQNAKSLLLQLEPYGMIIFIALMLTGILSELLRPIFVMLLSLML